MHCTFNCLPLLKTYCSPGCPGHSMHHSVTKKICVAAEGLANTPISLLLFCISWWQLISQQKLSVHLCGPRKHQLWQQYSSIVSCVLTLWTRESTLGAQNNYSAPYHIAQEATIMAQMSVHIFCSFMREYLPLSPSICLPRLCECLSRIFSGLKG